MEEVEDYGQREMKKEKRISRTRKRKKEIEMDRQNDR